MEKDRLSPSAIKSGLSTRVIGRKIICLDKVSSTNDIAWLEALKGAQEGTVVFAEEQSAGRGRFGRNWFSSVHKSVLCSVILRPNIGIESIALVNATGALSVAEACEAISGLKAMIRFPNDIVINGRKVSGILVESRLVSSQPDIFIIGIGVNVNIRKDELPADLRNNATSLLIESGTRVNKVLLGRHLIESMDRWYQSLNNNIEAIQKAWRDRSYILNKRVTINESGHIITGTVYDVDALSGIMLRLENGHIRLIKGELIEEVRLI